MSNTKEKIEPGKYVEFGYDVYRLNADGTETLVHQTDVEDPEAIIFGVTPGVIDALANALEGLEKGGKFDVTVKADDAFGPVNPEHIIELDRELFEVDGKFDSEYVKVGNVVPMLMADGFRINGLVLEVGSEKVKMDFNHPLAGKDVRFNGEVYGVRDATPEELHPSGGCCGCGSGDGCGCGDSCDCGDDCGCGDSCGCEK